jgi:hypothetical protein
MVVFLLGVSSGEVSLGLNMCWFHDYIPCGKEEVTYPKRGPYDPRSEADRTFMQEMEICAKCGDKREYDWRDYYY